MKKPIKAAKATKPAVKGKKIISSHLIETSVGPAVHIPSDMFDGKEDVSEDIIIPKRKKASKSKLKDEWNKDEIADFRNTLRVNWDQVEKTLLDIGTKPANSSTVTTLSSLVIEAVKKGRYDEAKIVLESLIQLKTIEPTVKAVA